MNNPKIRIASHAYFLDCVRRLKNPERIHVDTERTRKLHTERLPDQTCTTVSHNCKYSFVTINVVQLKVVPRGFHVMANATNRRTLEGIYK